MDEALVREHFLGRNTEQNRIRFLLWLLMGHLEELYGALDLMLGFELEEEETKDLFEVHFIEMEKLHSELEEKLLPLKEKKGFEKTQLHEAVRRTYNLLKGLNVIDLDKSNWAKVASMALPDEIFYRQIKLLIF